MKKALRWNKTHHDLFIKLGVSISEKIRCVVTCQGRFSKTCNNPERNLNDLKDNAGDCIEMKTQSVHAERRIQRCDILGKL